MKKKGFEPTADPLELLNYLVDENCITTRKLGEMLGIEHSAAARILKCERKITADDGSVSCHHEWALNRSIQRLRSELLTIAIGDFAQGVPFDEWPVWKQYAVEPPSFETVAALREEQTVASALNSRVDSEGRRLLGVVAAK